MLCKFNIDASVSKVLLIDNRLKNGQVTNYQY